MKKGKEQSRREGTDEQPMSATVDTMWRNLQYQAAVNLSFSGA